MHKPEDSPSVIGKLVDTLAKNENLQLNVEVMGKIKAFCKQSAANIPHLYHLFMTQLRKDNAKIRYNILLATNELFLRSSVFRKLVEGNLEEFLELTLETNPENLLPPPKSVADRLKMKTRCFVKDWHYKFGDKCKIMKYGYSFLQSCRKVDFQNITSAEEERQASESLRRVNSVASKISRTKAEMQSMENEIRSAVNQIETCFELVLPLPDDLFSNSLTSSKLPEAIETASATDSNGTESSEAGEAMLKDKTSLRHHGIHNVQATLNINVDEIASITVEENPDNTPILENMNDLYTQLCKIYLPKVSSWLRTLSKGENCFDHVKKAIDLKQMLESKICKFQKIKFKSKIACSQPVDDDKDSDSDFEEVSEKEGFELAVNEELHENSSDKEKNNSSSYSCKRSCRAILPSGKLCPRQDKYKCPFHGKIIERDDNGMPVGPCDPVPKLDEPSTSQEVIPDWQDPELLADIAAQTGINLTLPVKKSKNKSKRKKHELKDKKITKKNLKSGSAYSRLYKKVFKKARTRK